MADEQQTTKDEGKKPAAAKRTAAKAKKPTKATAAAASASTAKAKAKMPAKATAASASGAAKPKAPAKKRAVRRKAAPAAAAPVVEAPVAEAGPPVAVSANGSARSLPRLKALHISTVGPALIKEFNYSSPMQVPTIEKIIVNIGLGGEAITNPRALENASNDVSQITGQRPITNRARKSIANYKLREGMPVGVSTTMRGRRMWEFFDRLVASALPRIRDFRGLSRKSFDGRGNYAIGFREQVMFPEIDYNAVDRMRGLQVVVTTTAPNDREGLRLLELLGMPFTKSGEGTVG
jgi:large subunit ribosomal protein L5